MSTKNPSDQTHIPFEFDHIYATSGGRGKPIHTQEDVDIARRQLNSLLNHGQATLITIFRETTNLTLEADPEDPTFRVLKHDFY